MFPVPLREVTMLYSKWLRTCIPAFLPGKHNIIYSAKEERRQQITVSDLVKRVHNSNRTKGAAVPRVTACKGSDLEFPRCRDKQSK
jgi:hypothetical protein